MIRLFSILIVASIFSCKAYKQDIMFRLDDNFTEADLAKAKEELDGNYLLKPNDILLLDVFTNKGERLIDPNFEMLQQGGNVNMQQQRDVFQYVIQADGTALLPLLGKVKLEGMTLLEAELMLAEAYQDVYIDPFIKLRINNRRVFVLGAPGGQVIPLPNENTNLLEVLASAGGVDLGGKVQNIKLIRGDSVYLVDLSTVSGYMETNMNVEPGDVIYVVPWRRPWQIALTDITPILTLTTSIITLIVVIQSL